MWMSLNEHDDPLLDRGMRVRREVLGSEHVAAAQARTTDLDADFQSFITSTAWGAVWARPGLDRRTRSLVTIAILAAMGRNEELAIHLRATRNTGAGLDELKEVLLHVAVYAGVPAAHSAMGLAKAELGGKTREQSNENADDQGGSSHGGFE
jgi:4-carboxymuconolactone decarboxylase